MLNVIRKTLFTNSSRMKCANAAHGLRYFTIRMCWENQSVPACGTAWWLILDWQGVQAEDGADGARFYGA
jgi:hypothetical protein